MCNVGNVSTCVIVWYILCNLSTENQNCTFDDCPITIFMAKRQKVTIRLSQI